ncbi:MAG: GNAT family N-acetyltransferase [Dehalococcoidia bacterium]
MNDATPERLPLSVSVRPITAPDLHTVERSLPSVRPDVHSGRFVVQQAGEAVYLIAWCGDLPVGHVLLRRTGSTDLELRARLPALAPHPYLEGMAVRPDYQSRGIGTQILIAADHEVTGWGFTQIGLAVGIENRRARALYERTGYREAGLGEFPITWSYVTPDGREGTEGESCVYLVKPLQQASGR